MTKSTITITDDGKRIMFEVAHDPPITGPRETWSLPARAADSMAKEWIKRGKIQGLEPVFEASRNAITGDLSVITRQKESNGPDGTDKKAGNDDASRG